MTIVASLVFHHRAIMGMPKMNHWRYSLIRVIRDSLFSDPKSVNCVLIVYGWLVTGDAWPTMHNTILIKWILLCATVQLAASAYLHDPIVPFFWSKMKKINIRSWKCSANTLSSNTMSNSTTTLYATDGKEQTWYPLPLTYSNIMIMLPIQGKSTYSFWIGACKNSWQNKIAHGLDGCNGFPQTHKLCHRIVKALRRKSVFHPWLNSLLQVLPQLWIMPFCLDWTHRRMYTTHSEGKQSAAGH